MIDITPFVIIALFGAVPLVMLLLFSELSDRRRRKKGPSVRRGTLPGEIVKTEHGTFKSVLGRDGKVYWKKVSNRGKKSSKQ